MAAFQEDTYVLLQGLEKAPLLNGKLGWVRDVPDTETERYTVRLCESPCQLVNVRQANIAEAPQEEIEKQLTSCYQLLANTRLVNMLQANKKSAREDASQLPTEKAELIQLALQHQLFPEPVDAKPVFSKQTRKQQFEASLDEDVTLPGGKTMKRRQMIEQADALDKMTPMQMREQLRMMKSKSPQELRNTVPQMRQVTDYEIQAQISQLEQFVANPKAKKQYCEALRSGDFTQLAMDDDSLKRDAKSKLDLFRADPEEYRKQNLSPAQQDVSNAEIEANLVKQAQAKNGDELRTMRSEEMMAALTDDQVKENALLQLKSFNENPKKFRKMMGDQAKQLTDEDIRAQLEMMCKMSPADIRAMQQMSKAPGAAGPGSATPTPEDAQKRMESMTGEQLSAMFKMQRDMLKRDPAQFRRMMPANATMGMSDEALLTQLNTMAEMDPDSLKQYMALTSQFTGYLSLVKDPLDRITGGRGNYVLAFVALCLCLLLTYVLSTAVFRILAFLFPTTFGGSSSTAVATKAAETVVVAGGAAAGNGFVQNDVVLEDEFFQQNDDL